MAQSPDIEVIHEHAAKMLCPEDGICSTALLNESLKKRLWEVSVMYKKSGGSGLLSRQVIATSIIEWQHECPCAKAYLG